jgi:hypothetical protein
MTRLPELAQLGQAIWYDYIRRARPRRRIITFHLDQDGAGGLEKLMEAVEKKVSLRP